MKKNCPKFLRSFGLVLLAMVAFTGTVRAQGFDESFLDFNGFGDASNGITSLMFGPDGRLYTAEYPGLIKIYTIQRNGPQDYVVTAVEVLNDIQTMPDHNDDGSPHNSIERQVTGITVGGTVSNPVFYVSSSDFRIGAGSGGGNGDVGLDTNSGVVTRFSWTGSDWDVVDIVRGLPRSEENHSTNALELATINGTEYLIVASGGNTNGGAPSINFVYTCEYALSGAILAFDLGVLDALGIKTDGGRQYLYDLPTLDDPTRANVNGVTDPDDPNYNGIDVNDPWGGNDGLNMAILDNSSPVKMLSPGYRNSYDFVVTESGALYVTDNGANQGWGGFPENEGLATVNNDYNPAEPGSQSASGGEQIDNKDHLELVTSNLDTYTFGSFYGGHPVPVRANPSGAGLFTAPGAGTTGAVFRTQTYDPDGSTPGSTTDPSIALPANWPPVAVANPVEGDWRGPSEPNPDGATDNPVVIWGTNTNGIDEYTASNFGGAMQGDLLAGSNQGQIRRVQLDGSGGLQTLTSAFLSGISGDALGITCNGDNEIFPGTIWVGTLGGTSTGNPSGGSIIVYEPNDFLNCIEPGEPGYDPLADGDFDGYSNQDEEDNGTAVCNGGSQPNDFDEAAGGTLVSDLNDPDDDADGIADADDPFQLGDPLSAGSDAFTLPVSNALFNNQQGLGGIFGLGMTGLMNNGDTGANWLNWIDDRDNGPNPNDVLGGAPGIMTSHMTEGTALGATNTQEKGYQYGVQVDASTGPFTVVGGMNGFTGPLRLYENTNGVSAGELGFFIGDGTQSNYIKFVVNLNGFEILQEINDVPGTPITSALPIGDRPTETIKFYFEVNPTNGQVELEYQIDTNPRVSIATIAAQGTILEAIQQNTRDLAVGFIGSSNTPGKELEGSWDFLNVLNEIPVVVQEIPDVQELVGANDVVLNMDDYFDDNFGTDNLTYTVESNTNTDFGAAINGNLLTITFPATVGTSDITVRATDGDTNFVEDTFTVSTIEGGAVLYRVNSGGPQLTAIDGEMDWEEDTLANPSQYLVNPGSDWVFEGTINTYDPSVDQTTTPLEIFETERADLTPGAPNLTYSFPITEAGNYEVRLYMGNGFFGTSEAGERIFDVQLEGRNYPLLQDIDLSGTYGNNVGTVITHIIPVTDGSLDIQLLHDVIENPLINGIEILDALDNDTPIYAYEIPDQVSNNGEVLNGSLGVQAIGGDGNLQYAATGLPPGVSLEPTNGQIGGTIADGADAGSPYSVTITIDDSDGFSDDTTILNLTWEIFDAFSYRLNAGGNQITSTDIGPNWEEDSQSGAGTGGNFSVNTGTTIGFGGVPYESRDPSIPAYISEMVFDQIFAEERFDPNGLPDMEYTLDLENGSYVVNLYFANSFDDLNQVGDRIFDILIEGNAVENNLDLVEEFGHDVAGMLSYSVTVTDGTLNIGFGREVENPTISAIEVYKVDTGFPVLNMAPIANQTNEITNSVNLQASATGGDPSFDLEYYISGQPDGININPETGAISGTIAASAAAGGPNGDGVHNVVVTAKLPNSAPSSEVFTWTVSADFIWTDKNENENYTARHENSFVQAGDKFYLMGGRENAKTIDVYDYTNDTWESLVDSAPFEFNHFQATEYKGLIWIIGAFQTNNFPNEVPATNIWMFNPATEQWIEGPEIPVARRRGSTGLVVYNDIFYIVGGNNDGHDGGFVNQFDSFNPATGEWTVLPNAPRARDHFHSAVIGDKMYLAGGRLSGGVGGVWAPTIAEVDVFDFTSGTWSTLPSDQNIPTPRGAPASVNFNDKLVVIGGEVQDEDVYGVLTDDALKITEQYDPVTQTWKRLADLNTERHGTQAIVSGPGVHILAGAPSRGGGSQKNYEFLGEDSPVGSPSVASSLSAPTTLVVADGESSTLNVDVSGGNVGIFVESIAIFGADAADFSITSGDFSGTLLDPSSSNPLEIALSGTGADRTAILSITYDNGQEVTVILTNNANVDFDVTNPGNQFNQEGDDVSLQIEATSTETTTYSATNLPPTLTIDENTGLISGTISNGDCGGSGNNVFVEENGLVIIEAESTDLVPNWTITNLDNEVGILAGTNSFFQQNGGTLDYDVTITTPGVYRFIWNSFYSGPEASEENDNWLKFPNNDNVWFFGIDLTAGDPGTEADIINNLLGAQTDIVFPGGTARQTPATTPEGASTNGFLKIYKSGGGSENYTWQSFTSDNDPHNVYVYFVNPGTYTMQISERSAGHAIDRVALYKVDGPDYSDAQLNSFPESPACEGAVGAAENSPYNVTVTVTENGGATETIDFVWTIGLPGELLAVINADVLSGNIPLTVNFTGSNSLDDVGVTSYAWDFGDGGTSTEADPQHIFTTPGVYTVTLTVGDADGNTDTATQDIEVLGTGVGPTAVVSATPETGAPPLEVTFTGSDSTDDVEVVTYAWDFGDGGTSDEADPVYIYENPGTFTAALTVTDSEGLTDTATIEISVLGSGIPPTAIVSATPESGAPPLEVTFTGSNSTDEVAIATYAWDFGDGGTSDEADPVYTYVNSGTFTATLTVTDTEGLTDTATIDIVVNAAPVAIALADPVVGNNPLTVSFDGSTSSDDQDDIVSYEWDFGDGTGTSTEVSPQYEFTTPGVYTVSLTVTDGGGLTGTDTIDITVNENDSPIPVATASVTEGQAPLTVIFDGSGSTDDTGIESYQWDFKDGTTSTEVSPIKTFNTPGTYDVTLTVTDIDGLSAVATIVITVNVPNEAPVAVIEASVTEGEAPLEVSFTGSGSTDDVGIESYQWDFGDGTSSTQADPTHLFTGIGEFTVTLTVTDAGGLTDQSSILITVQQPTENEAPVAVASAAPIAGDVPLVVNFTGDASTDDKGIVSYSWDFGDGSPVETTPNTVHTYLTAGVYTAVFTVADEEGLTDTEVFTITVNEPNTGPEADIVASILSGEAPLSVDFDGSGSTDDKGIATYSWDFGDGATGMGSNPTHVFSDAGNFQVVLTVSDAEGLTDTASVTVTVTDNEPDMGTSFGLVAERNPVTDGVASVQLLDDLANETPQVFYVHDYTGRLVGSFDPQDIFDGASSYLIPVNGFRTSVYIITVETLSGKRAGTRIVIE